MTTPTTNPMPAPVEAVVQEFRKYVDFGGRATRAEYWWWVLFTVIGSAIFTTIDSFTPLDGLLDTLFTLAVLLPSLAVTARRLHDIGKTGWWQLGWYAVPITAWLVAGVMYLIAVIIEYGSRNASGEWSLDWDDVDWANSGEALGSFLPGAIVLIAAIVITLAVIVWAIVWMARRGETGQNRFGPDPRT